MMTIGLHRRHQKLDQAVATAICGNDILSSVFYVSGVAIVFAGIYAPLVFLFIGAILYLYKRIFTDVNDVLQANGGAYNCLLRSTSRSVASLGGIVTLLSYMATAIISAWVAVEYLRAGVESLSLELLGRAVTLPTLWLSVALLGSVALLTVCGLRKSSRVALGIFVFHMVTLAVFFALSIASIATMPSHLMEHVVHTNGIVAMQGGLPRMFALAFAASFIGVSGFESAANFVEEQKRGVFRKILRNMLLCVILFHPLVTVAVLHSLPPDAIRMDNYLLLADVANVIGGSPLRYLVIVDAFLILSGAVLTAFIGVSGLVHRMSTDGCFPIWLARRNEERSFPRIVYCFFTLCSAILILTYDRFLSQMGLYTVAFFGVLIAFAIGNLLLRRGVSHTSSRRSGLSVQIALFATLGGLLGSLWIDSYNLFFFVLFLCPAFIVITWSSYRQLFLGFMLWATQSMPRMQRILEGQIRDILEGKLVFFLRDISRLGLIMRYIENNVEPNEYGEWDVTLIHCRTSTNRKESLKVFEEIEGCIRSLQHTGFFDRYTITLVFKDQDFSPELVLREAAKLGIGENRILIGSFKKKHAFEYADFDSGIRVIFG